MVACTFIFFIKTNIVIRLRTCACWFSRSETGIVRREKFLGCDGVCVYTSGTLALAGVVESAVIAIIHC